MAEEHVLRIPIKAGKKGEVLAYLEKRGTHLQELDASYAAREEKESVMFVSQEAGEDVLFIYRCGRDLQAAGVRFLTTDSVTEREFAHILLEATHFERAKTLLVLFRWPALEAD